MRTLYVEPLLSLQLRRKATRGTTTTMHMKTRTTNRQVAQLTK